MSKPRPFRFGVSVHGSKSRAEWIGIARQAEALGYSTLLMPDHLGDQLSPIPALLAAADATSRSVRVSGSPPSAGARPRRAICGSMLR